MLIWGEFLACSGLILYSGTKIARYGDAIAEKTGLGRMWIGVFLMASVTSLPELITGISSAAIFGIPDIAAGDVFGSNVFNLSIIAILDLSSERPILGSIKRGHVVSAGFGIVLISVAALGVVIGDRLPSVGWVGSYSFVIIALYFISLRSIFVYEAGIKGSAGDEGEDKYGHLTHSDVYRGYAVNALIIVAAAAWLPSIGERLAAQTGLGQTFVGNLMVALATSLPELVVSVSAIRIGAVDMAVSGLLGSNLFNIGILAVDDVFYTRGPILSHVSKSHVLPALSAIVMSAVTVIGVSMKPQKKRWPLSLSAGVLALVFILNMLVLYQIR